MAWTNLTDVMDVKESIKWGLTVSNVLRETITLRDKSGARVH